MVADRDAVDIRARVAGRGYRADFRRARSRFSALSGLQYCRDQDDHQRPLHLFAGWQSAGRAGAWRDEFLVGLRGHGRLFPGRRRRTGAGAVDHQRRSGFRRFRHGCLPLRRLCDARLHQCQGAGKLFAPLFDPLSERGAARRPPAADDADLRQAEGCRCRVRRILRAGNAAVVCPRRCRRRFLLAALDRF
ncbi:hypothetical protein D3C73_569010 [compost metagenome]